MATKRKSLSIKDQATIVRKKDSGASQSQLAQQYGVSRCQIQNIVKRKSDVLRLDADITFNSDRKKVKSTASYDELDRAMWEWFNKARGNNIPISGPIIVAKAKEYANQLNIPDFRGSNGWLSRFKERHTIRQLKINGERASVSPQTIEDWIPVLRELIIEYQPRDIFNMDESGLQFRALPDKTLAARPDDAAGTKVSKDRLTLVLCCNMEGDFIKTLVIGRSIKPRCFKTVRDISMLPVTWKANRKAWMTGEFYTDWLKGFNDAMRRQSRKVLLFVDNAPAHPHLEQLSNVNVAFFPANATSLLQPLDGGIIKTIKAAYRNELLTFVIQRIEEDKTVTDIIKSVDVLRAITWISTAVNSVKSSTVQKCFKRCHFVKVPDQPEPEPTYQHSDNVFTTLQLLLISYSDSTKTNDQLTSDDFLAIDDQIVSREPLPEDWDMEIVPSLKQSTETNEVNGDDDDDDVPIPTVSSGLRFFDELERLFTLRGLESTSLLVAKTQLRAELPKTQKQCTLEQFFK